MSPTGPRMPLDASAIHDIDVEAGVGCSLRRSRYTAPVDFPSRPTAAPQLPVAGKLIEAATVVVAVVV